MRNRNETDVQVSCVSEINGFYFAFKSVTLGSTLNLHGRNKKFVQKCVRKISLKSGHLEVREIGSICRSKLLLN